jgi:hypothetical protein
VGDALAPVSPQDHCGARILAANWREGGANLSRFPCEKVPCSCAEPPLTRRGRAMNRSPSAGAIVARSSAATARPPTGRLFGVTNRWAQRTDRVAPHHLLSQGGHGARTSRFPRSLAAPMGRAAAPTVPLPNLQERTRVPRAGSANRTPPFAPLTMMAADDSDERRRPQKLGSFK